jgi:hypothetical protein
MCVFCKKALLTLLVTVFILLLTGCMGTLKMPINEYSHFNIEAEPFGGEIMLSYHRYDKLPRKDFTKNWTSKIKINSIGTIYDSQTEHSPLVTRVDRAWQEVKHIDPTEWKSVERLLANSSVDTVENERLEPTEDTRKSLEPWQQTDLPIAEIPLFLFSSTPRW